MNSKRQQRTPHQSRRTATKFSVMVLATWAFASGSAAAQSEASGAQLNSRPTVVSKPVPLPWRNINWPSLNFNRTAIDGGAALYTIAGETGKKLRIDLLFETGVYTVPRAMRTNLGATVDMFLLGGAGQRSYEELQRFLADNGIQVSTNISTLGQFHIALELLSGDFPKAIAALEDMILRPRFEQDALEIWKMEQKDSFKALLDGSSTRKQARFVEQEALRLAFGSDHYFAQSLARTSPPELAKVTASNIRNIASQIINRAGLNAILSGNINSQQQRALVKLLEKVPRLQPVTYSWLPDRVRSSDSKKIRMTIIQKNDLSQASLTLRYYLPKIGKLNRIERTRMTILREVFSSSGGVIGNDRFSKALRADSGISYGPYASFYPEAIEPNTNTGVWRMNFQSPNERLVEAVKLAVGTWKKFVTEGISQEELDNARIARINTTLATEQTVFDKVEEFVEDLQARVLPNPLGIEGALVRLEQEKSVSEMNQLLRSQIEAGTVPVLVAFGNPNDATLAELRKISELEIVKVEKFENIAKELAAGGPK